MVEQGTSHGLATPRLVPIVGGWMAVSTPESPLQIGVRGDTKGEAEAAFLVERAAWEPLLYDGRDGQNVA